jgi:DNA primase
MNYYIEQILQENKIVEFLQDRGIHCVRKSADKLFYRCPIHDEDKEPSFVVYPEGTEGRDYQTYHCFGCNSGITIINLKSDIDKISTKNAVKYFLKNTEIDEKCITDSLINEINNIKNEKTDSKIETLLLIINTICREHLIAYRDEEEIEFFDHFFKQLDRISECKDYNGLEMVLEILVDRGGLEKRVKRFQKRRENDYSSSLTSWRI